ncbi:MAG TPA: hypothetical protein VFO05_00265 [Candidatus Limnocylindrales bacterium]|nr:hypothetical protein [Candidatus Limnocylindrales bacterium]
MDAREARFDEAYRRLRSILEPYAPRMHTVADDDVWYSLDLAPESERTPATWFGAVRKGKRYVSYYLMPIYVEPKMLDDLSPELKKRMQGKSCFNFAKVDEALFTELNDLTKRGYERTAGDAEWGKRIRATWDNARSNR